MTTEITSFYNEVAEYAGVRAKLSAAQSKLESIRSRVYSYGFSSVALSGHYDDLAKFAMSGNGLDRTDTHTISVGGIRIPISADELSVILTRQMDDTRNEIAAAIENIRDMAKKVDDLMDYIDAIDNSISTPEVKRPPS